jgi:chemotaxis protein MotB
MKKIIHLFAACAVAGITACVPARKLDDMTARKNKCEEALSSTRAENLALKTKNGELAAANADMSRDMGRLEKDTTESGIAYRRLTGMYKELNDTYDRLITNNEKLSASKADETRKALAELQKAQEDLFEKEDQLKRKEAAFEETSSRLKSREARINELESLINKQDSMMKALKNNLSDALVGYKDKGISIREKDGMIYVSLEESLLFASGSIVVDKKGAVALEDLAQVLSQNPDIKVLIEGHTDNVPIATTCIKDNWDLSVLRATSVVRILMKNPAIRPVQLTPAGRGEYLPVDTANTAEARKKNRRIEVILVPDISKVLNLVSE